MVIEFRGREQKAAYLQAVTDEERDGLGTISPGGAGTMVGVSRQRIYELMNSNFSGVRTWFYFEGDTRQATYIDVSILDLLRWAVRVGRIQAGDDLPYVGRRWEEKVLRSEGNPAILKNG